MAKMPDETREKIRDGNRKAWASPAVRQRMITAIKAAWTPARRKAMSRERQAFWRKRREAKLEASSDAPPP